MTKSILTCNYVAVFIYITILISIYYRRMTKRIENRAIINVTHICLFTTVMDILMAWSYNLIPIWRYGTLVSYICGYGYFLGRQFTALAYIILIFVQTDTVYKLQKTSYRILFYLPAVLGSIFILSNLFTHKIFTVTAESYYKRGPLMPLIYVYPIFYGGVGQIYLCKMRRYLGTGKWLALFSSFFFLLGCAIYQYLNPGHLLEMMANAFNLLIVYLIVYRSEEIFDPNTQFYCEKAFQQQLASLIISGRSATVLMVNFTNASEARSYFGDAKFFHFIKKTGHKIEKIIGETNDYKLYYHSAGNIQIIFSQNNLDIDEKYPRLIELWTRIRDDSYTCILDPKICIAEFPEHLTTVRNMIQFSHFFHKYMKPGQTLLLAEDVINSNTFKIQENISEIITRGLRNNRFEVYYQPIFNLHTKKFSSAEALIRLNDQQYGYLSPGLFIPAAESMGLILPIGNFVLEKVFEFVSTPEFINLGLKYIELNLSVEQLLQKDFSEKIESLQKKYGTKPERINLEITESMAGLYSKTDVNNVDLLIKKNFSFSLDDYGTGYSNIKRAMDLPLSLVKIDKSIVDIVETQAGKTIIRNTITMMHDVGFKIVCEGVESEIQYQALQEMDCDYIQGYYFAEPMNKDNFVTFMKEKNG